MKLFAVGTNTPNAEEWSIWDEVKIVIAENEKRAREIAGAIGGNAVEIPMDKEQLLADNDEPNWGDDI